MYLPVAGSKSLKPFECDRPEGRRCALVPAGDFASAFGLGSARAKGLPWLSTPDTSLQFAISLGSDQCAALSHGAIGKLQTEHFDSDKPSRSIHACLRLLRN